MVNVDTTAADESTSAVIRRLESAADTFAKVRDSIGKVIFGQWRQRFALCLSVCYSYRSQTLGMSPIVDRDQVFDRSVGVRLPARCRIHSSPRRFAPQLLAGRFCLAAEKGLPQRLALFTYALGHSCNHLVVEETERNFSAFIREFS